MNDSLTKADIEKMRAEIEHRKLVVRPQLISEVKRSEERRVG